MKPEILNTLREAERKSANRQILVADAEREIHDRLLALDANLRELADCAIVDIHIDRRRLGQFDVEINVKGFLP